MSAGEQMFVTKRNGQREEVAFDKILNRAKNLCNNIQPNLKIAHAKLVMKVIDQLYDNISTSQIDELLAEQCASLSTKKLDYGALASRIVISNHQKNTPDTFVAAMEKLYTFTDSTGKRSPLISKELWQYTQNNAMSIETAIDYDRDFLIDYFGFKTL